MCVLEYLQSERPADTAKVFFTVLPNEDDARECKVSFTSYSTNDKKEVISSEAFCTVSQKSGLAYFEEPFTAEPYKFIRANIIRYYSVCW